MNKILKKISKIPWVAEFRRNRRIRTDARRIANCWTSEDELMLVFYGQFLNKGDLCFDVGANVGNRLKIFQKIGARVIAVEPQKQCAQQLVRCYGSDKNIVVVEKALSDAPGVGKLLTSNFHMVSSLSEEWVSATQASGRFAQHRWSSGGVVDLVTMDELIHQYGRPRFAKIDVEGFELKVIKGLSQAIPFLSLEFTPETIDSSLECLDHLSKLGEPLFNFCSGESMKFEHQTWINLSQMRIYLQSLRMENEVWGDIYISFPSAS